MTPEEVKKEIEAALSALSVDPPMGYLAVTSKPELPVRDRVAWYFHLNHPDFIAAREYYIKSRRVDLALLKKASLEPVVLVEFKAMSAGAPDPLDNPEHHLMLSLIGDLEKLANITDVPRFGVMLKVHIEDAERLKTQRLDQGVVKYISRFRKRTKEPDALQKAIANVRPFFNLAKLDVSALPIELGFVWEARVSLTALILEPWGMRPSGLDR